MRILTFDRRAIAWLGGGCLLLASSLSAETVEEKLKSAFTQVGPRVEESAAPGAYRALEGMLADLTAAQRRTTHSRLLLVNRIHLVESPEINAFVLTHTAQGIEAQENHVFVTTGLLRQFFSGGPTDPREAAVFRRERYKALAGVVLHELGHPVDMTGEFQLGRTYGWTSNQAQELRADYDGRLLAREAHYPEDAVYQGKELLRTLLSRRGGGSRRRGVLGVGASYLSDHPDLGLNQTVNRLLLTAGRMQQGKSSEAAFDRRLGELGPSFDAEVASLPAKFGSDFVPPATLAEAASRLQETLGSVDRLMLRGGRGEENGLNEVKRKEINRLVLALDRRVREAEAKGPLPPAERTAALEAYRGVIELDAAYYDARRQRLLYRGEEVREYLAPEGTDSYFTGVPPHDEALHRVELFRSKDYLEMLRKMAQGGGYGELETREPANILIRHARVADFLTLIPDIKHFDLRSSFKDPETDLLHDLRTEPLKTQIDFGVHLLRKKFLGAPLSAQAKFFMDLHVYSSGDQAPILFLAADLEPEELDRKRKETADHLATDAEAKKAFADSAREIWRNRGAFYLLMLGRQGDLDWVSVARWAGVTEADPEGSALAEARRIVADPQARGELMKQVSLKADLQRALSEGEIGLLREMARLDPAGPGAAPLRSLAHTHLAASDADFFRERYREKFREALASRAGMPPAKAVLEAHQAVVGQWGSDFNLYSSVRTGNSHYPVSDIVAEEIQRLPGIDHRAWLEQVFFRFDPELHHRNGLGFHPGTWASDHPKVPGVTARAAAVLEKAGFGPASARLLAIVRLENEGLWKDLKARENTGSRYDFDSTKVTAAYAQALDALTDPLKAELAGADRAKLLELAAIFKIPGGPPGAGATTAARRLGELREAFFAAAQGKAFSPAERLSLFRDVAAAGPSVETDAYFRGSVYGHVSPPLSASQIEGLLREGLIFSRSFQADLAREALGPDWEAPVSHESLARLVARVERMMPDRSSSRDELLEHMAWRLNISEPGLLRFLESHKSTNLRAGSPATVRWISALGEVMHYLDEAGRWELMRYLRDPSSQPFTPELKSAVRRASVRLQNASGRNRRHHDTLAAAAEERAIQAIQQLALDSKPHERLPVLDILLNLDKPADPAEQKTHRERVGRELLGIVPGSEYERALGAYLDLVPPHERTVALAYLMAFSQEKQGSIASLFQAFGFPGIRAGQQSVPWGILPPSTLPEVEQLYDRAAPQTRAEILEILTHRFPDKGLRLVRLLGSASSVTAVEVEWDETQKGRKVTRRAAVLLRRPHALDQLRTHVEMGRAYVARLREQGLHGEAAFTELFLDATVKQMEAELDFRNVGRNLEALAATVERQNRGLGKEGLRFRVPGVIHDFGAHEDILFMEVARGTTFQRLPAEQKGRFGEPLARLVVQGIFRGNYQANPHGGNFIVEPATGGGPTTVWVIDGGQVGALRRLPLVADEPYQFAQFLKALGTGDAREVVERSLKLGAQLPPSADRAALERDIASALSEPQPLAERVKKVINLLVARGLVLDPKFTFTGGLKPLLELTANGVVSPEILERILNEEVRNVLVSKPLVLAADTVLAAVGPYCDAFFRRTKPRLRPGR